MSTPLRVEILWLDAQTVLTESLISEVLEAAPLVERFTIGYLVAKDDTRIIVAHDYDPPDSCSNLTVIPRDWVKRITTLAPALDKGGDVAYGVSVPLNTPPPPAPAPGEDVPFSVRCGAPTCPCGEAKD